MRVIAHYYRYHVAQEEEFDSLEDAVSFLRAGWENGDLAQDRIEVIPQHVGGKVKVYDNEAVFKMITDD